MSKKQIRNLHINGDKYEYFYCPNRQMAVRIFLPNGGIKDIRMKDISSQVYFEKKLTEDEMWHLIDDGEFQITPKMIKKYILENILA